MKQPKVWTFFYGSYINLNVLIEVDLVPEQYEVAKLSGFDIQIQPLANLVRSDQHCVYGIVATATHNELKRLRLLHQVEELTMLSSENPTTSVPYLRSFHRTPLSLFVTHQV